MLSRLFPSHFVSYNLPIWEGSSILVQKMPFWLLWDQKMPSDTIRTFFWNKLLNYFFGIGKPVQYSIKLHSVQNKVVLLIGFVNGCGFYYFLLLKIHYCRICSKNNKLIKCPYVLQKQYDREYEKQIIIIDFVQELSGTGHFEMACNLALISRCSENIWKLNSGRITKLILSK